MNSADIEDRQAAKAVEDRQGFEAWWKLTHRRAPRNMASVVHLVGLVASPPKISELAKVADTRGRSPSDSESPSQTRARWASWCNSCQRRPTTLCSRPRAEVRYEETVKRVQTFVADGPVPTDIGHAHTECYGRRGTVGRRGSRCRVDEHPAPCTPWFGACAQRLSHGCRQPEVHAQGKGLV